MCLPSQLVDALNQATTITRNLLGRPTSITQADGRSTTLRYDLTGTTNNAQLNYLYTPAGQISQLNWGSNPLLSSITYTPLGQPSSWNWEFADANAGTVLPASRTYDTAGRVIQTESWAATRMTQPDASPA